MESEPQDPTTAYPPGTIVDCVVTRVEPFAVFVELRDDRAVAGIIHRRDWDWHRRVFDLPGSVRPGEVVQARVVRHHRHELELSRRRATPDPYPAFRQRHAVGETVLGEVELIAQRSAGVIVSLDHGVDGFIPRQEIPDWGLQEDGFGLLAQDLVAARIMRFDDKQVRLSIREQLRARDKAHAASSRSRRAALRYHPVVGIELEGLYWNLQLREFAEPEISPQVRARIRRILVVEDSGSVSASLEMVLRHFGFVCELAGTVEDARARLAEHRYDLLILDINLPASSGVELIRELGGISTLVYVFVLTATAADEWAELMEETLEPVTCVFQKPTSVTRIFEQLNRQIAGQPTEDDRRHPAGVDTAVVEAEQALAWSGRAYAGKRREKIERILTELRRDTGATGAFVLSLRPGPIFERVAGEFPELTREVQQSLEVSPVGDVIRERTLLVVPDVDRRRSHFKHLLEVVELRSFAGLALEYADQVAYGLFLTDPRPGRLARLSESRLRAAAGQIGHHLAQRRFDEVIAENQGLLLTGFLADSLLHEIKNELQALDDFSAIQLLLTNRSSESPSAMSKDELVEFTRATVGVRQVSQRLNELTILFRNLAGRSPAARVDLNQVIRRIEETLRPFADEKGVTIATVLDEEIPELLVHPKLVDQPILNIMINGIEQMALTGSAARRLTVTTEYLPDDDDPVRVTIADTGRGVHLVDAERIFDLFFTTKEQGTGLGLYLSRFFVERFGGRLSLSRSIMFSGSEFTIAIPRKVLA